MKKLLPLLLIISACQSGTRTPLSKKELDSKWPSSLEKIVIYCSSDQQTIEVTPKNYQKRHDCQDLPGASHIQPVFKKDKLTVRVMAQAIQHITLMNEGPHVDLTEWKSGKSEMIDLEMEKEKYKLKAGTFGPFPSFTNQELVEAVKAKIKTWGGKPDTRWYDIAKKCGTDPDKYPCGLGTSEYKVRVEVPADNSAIEFAVALPMGC